jgi:spermidine/putrescine transport system substrate-binding protein
MKYLVSLVLLAALSIGTATFAQDTQEIEPYVCPEGFEGQELHIFNWSTYIAENTVPDFEAACGVTVTYDTYESYEEMLTRIRLGNPGFDIIFPGGFQVPVMIQEGLLVPANQEYITNIPNLVDALEERPYDPGNVYTVPYLISTAAIGYNTEVFPDGITSWEQVWNHDGPVAWADDPRIMLGMALLLLGYDPNSEDPDQLAEARDYLLERGDNVVAITADDGQVLLERGDVDITVEYNGDVLQVMTDCECDTFSYAIPQEGASIELDAVAIPVDAPNPDLASVFMNYLLHPQVAADIANYTAYGSPNQAAIDSGLIDAELLSNPAIYPAAEVIGKLFFVNAISAEGEELYSAMWDEVLVLIGSN